MDDSVSECVMDAVSKVHEGAGMASNARARTVFTLPFEDSTVAVRLSCTITSSEVEM